MAKLLRTYVKSLNRTPSTLTLSSTSLTVEGGVGQGSFTYNYNGDGKLSISSSNSSVATAYIDISSKTVYVTYIGAGSCTITINAAQTPNYNSTSAACSITCSRSSLTIPTIQSATVYCTGSYTGPVVYNYNSSLENQSGTTGTTILGTYTITWTLKDTNKYCWSDSSTGSKSVTWNCVGGTISITWTWTYSAGDRNGWITSNLTYKNKWSDYSSGSGYTRIAGPTNNYFLFVSSTGELITGYYYKTISYWKDTSAGSGPVNGGKYGGRSYIGSW